MAYAKEEADFIRADIAQRAARLDLVQLQRLQRYLATVEARHEEKPSLLDLPGSKTPKSEPPTGKG